MRAGSAPSARTLAACLCPLALLAALAPAAGASNLLDPGSWSKSATPVFQTSDEAGVFGPGHNSFTVEAGYGILIYRARSCRDYRDIEGDPLADPNRDTRAQVMVRSCAPPGGCRGEEGCQ